MAKTLKASPRTNNNAKKTVKQAVSKPAASNSKPASFKSKTNNAKKTVKQVISKPAASKSKPASCNLKTRSGNGSKTKLVSFSYFDPEAGQVLLVGDFNSWSLGTTCTKKRDSGEWATSITLKPGTYNYRFIVDGEWREDPKCMERVPNPFGSFNDRIIVK